MSSTPPPAFLQGRSENCEEFLIRVGWHFFIFLGRGLSHKEVWFFSRGPEDFHFLFSFSLIANSSASKVVHIYLIWNLMPSSHFEHDRLECLEQVFIRLCYLCNLKDSIFKTWGRSLTHFSIIFYREKIKKFEKHRYQHIYQQKHNIYRRSDKRKTVKNLKSSIGSIDCRILFLSVYSVSYHNVISKAAQYILFVSIKQVLFCKREGVVFETGF